MKRLIILLLLLVALPLLVACVKEEPEDTPSPCQFDYLTADIARYGSIAPACLAGLTLTLPPELAEADADTLRRAEEEVLLSHLRAHLTCKELPPEDYAYQYAALSNYFESLRAYDNTLVSLYGDPADISPDLASYLMRSFDLSTPEEAMEQLAGAAEELTLDNLAVAAAFHVLRLTVTEEVLAAVTAALTEETGETPADTAYLCNQALYETLMDYLLSPDRCTVLFAAV